MNITTTSVLRAAALVATLFVLPAVASAKNPAATDRASELLNATGSLPVQAAGPYVEVGTFRIQVAAKLGHPAAQLPDGTWLYQNFAVEDESALGTLVVRFKDGRVSALSLATPAVVAALRSAQKSADARVLVAGQNRP